MKDAWVDTSASFSNTHRGTSLWKPGRHYIFFHDEP